MKVAYAVLLSFVLGACASHPPVEPKFTARQLSEDIRVISSDDFEGRFPGSEGERKTLQWLQAQYEEMGLEPGGPNGEWLQRFELKVFTPRPGSSSASWTSPDGASHPLTIGPDIVVRAATNDGRARIDNAPLVFAGYGISAPSRGWDDYGDIDVSGKVVVMLLGRPLLKNLESPAAFEGESYKTDEAFRRGAVGVVFLWADPELYPRYFEEHAVSPRRPTPGLGDVEFSSLTASQTARQWFQAAGRPYFTESEVTGGQFEAFNLVGVHLSVRAEESAEVMVTHNLFAKIEGSERPDESVIYSAHWDHLGGPIQNPANPTPDKVWNGAWDNASGTAAVVEMARQLSRAPRPERTVVFAHMGAEELGLMGTYAYVANPVYPLATTVAVINIDMLPLTGPTRDVSILGKGENELEDRLEALARPLGRYISDDHAPGENLYRRSDHFPFVRAGVPALAPWHGWDLIEGGREAGEAAYGHMWATKYHRTADEWSADWDLRSAIENLGLLYRLGLDLANSNDWPGWKPGSEYSDVRARSAPARR